MKNKIIKSNFSYSSVSSFSKQMKNVKSFEASMKKKFNFPKSEVFNESRFIPKVINPWFSLNKDSTLRPKPSTYLWLNIRDAGSGHFRSTGWSFLGCERVESGCSKLSPCGTYGDVARRLRLVILQHLVRAALLSSRDQLVAPMKVEKYF